MKGTFILKMAGITEQIILLKCPSFSCADTYARTHSTYSEEEGKEGGIFCNQRNGNMLLVRLMPTGREEAGRERGEEKWDWCVAVGKIWETAAAVRLNCG